jgi:hypothetical protein
MDTPTLPEDRGMSFQMRVSDNRKSMYVQISLSYSDTPLIFGSLLQIHVFFLTLSYPLLSCYIGLNTNIFLIFYLWGFAC